ncbi:hypothetical protein [Streptosporangium sp. KLBMP 9127]|nr:hypothetical protein [Streptosporangium sp. KLBMP 9127]
MAGRAGQQVMLAQALSAQAQDRGADVVSDGEPSTEYVNRRLGRVSQDKVVSATTRLRADQCLPPSSCLGGEFEAGGVDERRPEVESLSTAVLD